ncbi:MAG: hypothetical protein M3O22_03055 [Pseudomonadota bacterium]|nr:hypothetical protein [Pseudomonadota bacterium]
MRTEGNIIIYGSGALVVGPNADISMHGTEYIPWNIRNCHPVMFIDMSRADQGDVDRVIDHSRHAWIDGVTDLARHMRDRWKGTGAGPEEIRKEKSVEYRETFGEPLPDADQGTDVVDLFRTKAEETFDRVRQNFGKSVIQGVHSDVAVSPYVRDQEAAIVDALGTLPGLYRKALDHTWTRIVASRPATGALGASFYFQRIIAVVPEILERGGILATVLKEEVIHHADSMTRWSEKPEWQAVVTRITGPGQPVPGLVDVLGRMDEMIGKQPASKDQPRWSLAAELLVNAVRLRELLPQVLKGDPALAHKIAGPRDTVDDMIRKLCPPGVDLPAQLDRFEADVARTCGFRGPGSGRPAPRHLSPV